MTSESNSDLAAALPPAYTVETTCPAGTADWVRSCLASIADSGITLLLDTYESETTLTISHSSTVDFEKALDSVAREDIVADVREFIGSSGIQLPNAVPVEAVNALVTKHGKAVGWWD